MVCAATLGNLITAAADHAPGTERLSRASAKPTSGHTPTANNFTFPARRYFSRQ